ncbi:S-methyl-5-thioribose-1-phosphate isomerase [Desulfoscipio gibsoniae]|uniref:Methylthioribose-1-phosphate isomerase n=1 Tax=Desulfoscipio gibsoniae DSM 7213 TaxID=767817 RepID=R4KRC0_9FIRM|nr:S-methyl-5-thioribose-1-phosphate isomerase [Desulfoscipio gibsoniae]AGL02161.1 S-methyl-5-thioribose-1-phosphate isomerase [Desulfoscipio gibsoniae DSM 7213]
METMRWVDGCLEILDQTLLPGKAEYIKCEQYTTVCDAICRLSVRGAPAIGAAAAYGLVLGAAALKPAGKDEFIAAVEQIARNLSVTRPTAVNLQWALDRMLRVLHNYTSGNVEDLKETLLREAHAIYAEDLESNRRMGEFGEKLVPTNAAILTHCNAGALATAGIGTALGVIRAAHQAGKNISVYADETRPLLQGARLTTWEMVQEKIPVTLLTDNMAGYLMACGKVDLVIVGADRIAANGDVANKIGTYGVAVLAKEHGLPFYVAAPMSTIDFNIASGQGIPIENRDDREVTCFAGQQVAPEGVKVWNPAFDVTPAHLVTAIITDRGVARPPYTETLAALAGR